MSEKIDRRTLIAGAGLSSLALMQLGGCAKNDGGGSKRPHYVMVFDQNKCVGCGDCKTACTKVNDLVKGQARLTLQFTCGTDGKAICPKEDAPRGYASDRRYVRVSCQQCEDAPCVKVCPTGAAHRDEATGIVTMNPDKCVGSKYCIVACPYNVRFINEKTKAADNCNFCLDSRIKKGNMTPGCVESCKYDALVFGDAADPTSYVAKLLKVKDSVRIRPELGTNPSVRYIPIVKKGA